MHLSTAQFADFWNNTPLYMFGTYLGGSGGNEIGCTPIPAATLTYAIGLGYGDIPFWFGPQLGGACEMRGWQNTISLDPSTAFEQGKEEAQSAAAAAEAEGYNLNDGIFYDLEAFYNASGCITAAQNFLEGWDYWLDDQTPYEGDVYGSECASYLSSYAGIIYVPDAIAPADQVHGASGASASVYGLSCLPDGYWNRDQRVRQYEDSPPQVYWSVNGSGSIPVDVECADAQVNDNRFTSTLTMNNCEYRYGL